MSYVLCVCTSFSQPRLIEGFLPDSTFNEQTSTFAFFPEIRIHINASQQIDPGRPTTIVFYALPNGNTIEQTIGPTTG